MALGRLVMLPGMDGTGDLFRPLVRVLPSGIAASIVTYPKDRVLPYSELHVFLDAAFPQEEPYVLLAESFSGPLAIEHCARQSPNLRGLILCGSFASNPVLRSIRWLCPVVHLAAWLNPPPRWMVRRFLLGPDSSDGEVDAVRAAVGSVSRGVLASRIRQVMRVDVSAALARIEVPVLYLAGRHDRLVGHQGLEQIRTGLASLSSTTLDGPHLLLQARPLEAASRISEFMENEVVA